VSRIGKQLNNTMPTAAESSRRILLHRTLALAIVLGLGIVAWTWLRELPYQNGTNYSAMPPEKAFTAVFGYAPPNGVTNLRAAGHTYIWQQRVWMSFDATSALLRKLTGGEEADSGEAAAKLLHQASHVIHHRDGPAMRAAGWDEIDSIPRPQIHFFSRSPTESAFSWNGALVIDPQRKRIYVGVNGE
jgi:hypothetical protein